MCFQLTFRTAQFLLLQREEEQNGDRHGQATFPLKFWSVSVSQKHHFSWPHFLVTWRPFILLQSAYCQFYFLFAEQVCSCLLAAAWGRVQAWSVITVVKLWWQLFLWVVALQHQQSYTTATWILLFLKSVLLSPRWLSIFLWSWKQLPVLGGPSLWVTQQKNPHVIHRIFCNTTKGKRRERHWNAWVCGCLSLQDKLWWAKPSICLCWLGCRQVGVPKNQPNTPQARRGWI